MENIRESFRAVRVLVIGDVMLDEYVVGAVSRISPEAPVPVLDVRSRYSSAGGAANVAMNIASLGAAVDLAGIVGTDPAAASLRQLLPSHDYLLEAPDRATISKTRIVAGQQQICRIDNEDRSAIPPQLLTKLLHHTAGALERCQIVVLSDYAKGTLTGEFCQEIIRSARAGGKQVIVDPKSNDFRKYLGCHLITPNQNEAAAAAGVSIDSPGKLQQAGGILQTQLPEAAILITRGPDGMALFQPGQAQPITIPTQARKVFDVVGAGDTVAATLAVALAAKLPLFQAVQLANLAAGIVVEKPGTATVPIDELEARYLSGS